MQRATMARNIFQYSKNIFSVPLKDRLGLEKKD